MSRKKQEKQSKASSIVAGAETLCKLSRLLVADRAEPVMVRISQCDLLLLHGLVCLAAAHPGIQDMSPQSKEFIFSFREVCRKNWVELGLTEEEAEGLDRLQEVEALFV